MLKYRGHELIRAGFIGAVLIALIVAVGLQPQRLWDAAHRVRYQAMFTEAGGLTDGNTVTVSGLKVGTVSGVSLVTGKALVTFSVDSAVPLGSQTSAHIETGTLLGERVLNLESAGSARLRPLEMIPVSRTSSPYSLTQAVSDLTNNVADTDTDVLNQSLGTLSSTLDQIAPKLGPTFDGLARVSTALNDRDETLRDLLDKASDITAILSRRSQQINTLIIDGNLLLQVLVERRRAIVGLLANTSAVAEQLSGLVHDNEEQLAPALQKINAVLAVLEKNRDNISEALPGLAKMTATNGETVSNGNYYSAYIPNLNIEQTLQPFMDYAFGFRRGTDNGQPPDNAGPRAEIPFPYNGIPQPGERWPR